MNERDITLLDQYFNGLLTAEEQRAVEARTEADPVFGADFSLRRKMEAFPRQEAAREALVTTLQSVGAEFFQSAQSDKPELRVSRNNLQRWIVLAASLALVAAAIWFFSQPGTPVYEQYAQHPSLSLTVMGETEQAKTEAETAFAQQNYERAMLALEQVLMAEPDNLKARFYLGICLLELRRAAEARVIFEPIASGGSALREDAIWYVGLSYLQEQNMSACRATLEAIEPGQAHYPAAQKILRGI